MCIFYDRQQMDKQQLKQLQEFVEVCKSKPEVLHTPELSFYREWLLRYVVSWRIHYDTYVILIANAMDGYRIRLSESGRICTIQPNPDLAGCHILFQIGYLDFLRALASSVLCSKTVGQL